jgi:hypothetical protein
MGEGLSVQLVHNPSEDPKTVGDVTILHPNGTVLAQCAGFQHNRNMGKLMVNAAALTKQTVEAIETSDSAAADCCAKASAVEGSACCGTKAESKAESDCCAHDDKVQGKALAEAAAPVPYHLYGGAMCAAVLVTLTLRAALVRA